MNIDRIDIIGQNGNEGEHYEAPSSTDVAVEDTIEKVELLQNMLSDLREGISPTQEDLDKAFRLGINTDLLKVFEDDN